MTNIADRISRQYKDTPRSNDNGSDWTVSPDWEEQAGLVHGINQVAINSGTTALIEHYKGEPIFKGMIEALLGIKSELGLCEHKRAHHCAANYMIEDEWYIGGGTPTRVVTCREFVTQTEAVELAHLEHEMGGHFHHDLIKIALLDRIHSPKLNQSIMRAISDCAKCKNFGSTHLNALLQPIMHQHPFELLVGNYLSMLPGKGGYHTISLYLDTCSQHVWGHKFKMAGTGKMTVKSLTEIFQNFTPAEMFMSDGGRHFENAEVDELCEKWGSKHHVVSAYLPWVNSLVEGTNRILLYILPCLCAPEIGEDG